MMCTVFKLILLLNCFANLPSGSNALRIGAIMGEEIAHDSWAYRYNAGFAYSLNGNHFIYAQSIIDGHHWFIQRLSPNGQMGREISHGVWDNDYRVTFPFNIENRQFFYGHNLDTRYWFIQELLPDGRMGGETENGRWGSSYGMAFPFIINDRHYFYSQNLYTRRWFIRELLPGGKMGKETDNGRWDNAYGMGFSFRIHDRHYFYAQNLDTRYWFIRELLPDGKMGKETDNGRWAYSYKIEFPFKLCQRTYFYAQSIIGGNTNWFIQELLPGGTMGRETDHGSWSHGYDVSFPYAVKDRVFFVGFGGEYDYNWYIQELKLNGQRHCPTNGPLKDCVTCDDLTSYDLKFYFNNHLKQYGSHCVNNRKRRTIDCVVDNIFASLGDIIGTFRNSDNVRVIHDPRNNPILEYGEFEIRGQYLPAYIVARIEFAHLRRSDERPRIPLSIYNHLRYAMDSVFENNRAVDDAGHLLAHALGGPTDQTYNFIPMSRLLNRGHGSIWRQFERRIASFLNDERQGVVDWRLAVIYDRSTTNIPTTNRPTSIRPTTNRPFGICMQFSEIDGSDDVTFLSDEVCMSNDPTDTSCEVALNPYCRY